MLLLPVVLNNRLADIIRGEDSREGVLVFDDEDDVVVDVDVVVGVVLLLSFGFFGEDGMDSDILLLLLLYPNSEWVNILHRACLIA